MLLDLNSICTVCRSPYETNKFTRKHTFLVFDRNCWSRFPVEAEHFNRAVGYLLVDQQSLIQVLCSGIIQQQVSAMFDLQFWQHASFLKVRP